VDESENMQSGMARTDPHLALLRDIVRVLTEASSEHGALTMIVERICAGLRWEYGAMAKSLGLGLVAEGVETRQQREFLRAAGCNAYQGYYIGVPVPANAFAELVRRQVRQKQ
jgi:EAL domain-containing protein (putative c-di-GMP-specific phosphodiesterase class I)